MIDKLIQFSIARRWLVIFLVTAVAALGVWNYQHLPIDAVPDITNVQVQINTEAPGYSPLEVEQRVTYLVELAITGLPHVESTRSLSRYALSQVTVVFDKGTDIYFARNLINERLQRAKSEMPVGIEPVMGPVATGLGEIFHYAVHAQPGALQDNGEPFDATALRTLQDWVIRPQLRLVPGVTEVNTIGGFEKQFHITPAPAKLLAYHLSFDDIVAALQNNNANVGAGYIEKNGEQYLIRAPGQVADIPAIEKIVVARRAGVPITVADVADVGFGKELRTGAATLDGEETVLGTAVMLLGGNSRTVSQAVSAKLVEINKTLPEGVIAEPVYNRTVLVDKTIATVQANLAEGALLVVVVLLVMLGNVRAALLTAMVIPLSMLMLMTGMVQTKVSANLMSLGALDFGLIVDGAVIIVENCIARLAARQHQLGRTLALEERFQTVFSATREVFTPSLISVLVVILVNLPILALTGVEGKMFTPMAMAVIMALLSALVLSLTFVPAAVALCLSGHIEEKDNLIVRNSKRLYAPVLAWVLKFRLLVLAAALVFVVLVSVMATRMGTEFIPNLDEGDIAIQALRIPGTSLTQSLDMQFQLEKAVLEIPEVKTYFSRVGTAEVASDPMGPNISDGYVMLKDHSEWPNPDKTKAQLLDEISAKLSLLPGNAYEISQPIQLRFNELISGVRSDLGIKIFGDDLQQLLKSGGEIAALLNGIEGAEGVKVEQVSGLPILSIEADRSALYRYGLNVADVQDVVAAATGGEEAGLIFEGDQRFSIVVRLAEHVRSDLSALERLPIPLPDGGYVPLQEVASLTLAPGPNQISRENGKRRLVVSANVRDRDLGGFVAEAQDKMAQNVKLPPGYWLEYGGTFEQLQSASQRLSLLVPVTLVMIFALLMMTFGSAKDAALVFSGVPLALTGGVIALWLRDIPLSITAGVGFITLCGVSVLTGVMMVSAFRDVLNRGEAIEQAIVDGAMMRLRPILMVALVAALGFLPMALNTSTGAEVQMPLATVVIGGIISSTLLTLLVLPGLYRLTWRAAKNKDDHSAAD
ncbi:MAG: CusA/CzcA family heavy metal efflux RND transporter [Thalassolituus oleivorans]|uniref:efflux RND transporter permease subunit n=1 Tax=Thalassolituus oleivorans TaxID=187493 RepID=UPI001B441BE9|nr:CusA/CzcA family heavy metal efflux RND transporter [Thalassolituus oleivorans]MBQ0728234.1 CusA/CzcA family heavy metal efflux RND transporter [Thalassolituus oleivorans]MBQ0780765.1 CusA/CzcA family heavy metal efflux RND transporter [Thalassolituus oleivorans]